MLASTQGVNGGLTDLAIKLIVKSVQEAPQPRLTPAKYPGDDTPTTANASSPHHFDVTA